MRGWARPLLGAAALLLAPPAPAKPALRPGERIDLNRASVAELTRLPGIGVKRAQAIVEHRRRRPFRTPADVLAVKGLSKAWFGKVRNHLVTSSAERRPGTHAGARARESLDFGPSAALNSAPQHGSEEQGSRSKSGAVPPL